MVARRGLVLLLAITIAACGLRAVGSKVDEIWDATAPDAAAPTPDAGELVVVPLPASDGNDVPINPIGLDASCPAVEIKDPLAQIGPDWRVSKSGGTGPYPQKSTLRIVDGNQGIDQPVILLLNGANGARGGIWLNTLVPLRSFDVSFRWAIQCDPMVSCADGLSATWAQTSSFSEIDNAGIGASFGLPSGVPGGAAVVDVWSGRQPTPAVRLFHFGPGAPNAAIVQSPKEPMLTGFSRRTFLQVNRGVVAITVDTLKVPPTAMPTIADEGRFGLTATTGGESALFAIWDLEARFYDCDR